MSSRRTKISIATLALLACYCSAFAQSEPTVLVDVDHREAQSLNGDWHIIVDPYFFGLYSFHHEIRKDGYFIDANPSAPTQSNSAQPIEYDFAKSPTLKVPADWNTQRDNLFWYEGPLWYERHFDFTPQARDRSAQLVGDVG